MGVGGGPAAENRVQTQRKRGCWELRQGAAKDNFLSQIFLRHTSVFFYFILTLLTKPTGIFLSYIVLSYFNTDLRKKKHDTEFKKSDKSSVTMDVYILMIGT